MDKVLFGKYICQRCMKDYTANDVAWRLCTPEFCHDCLAKYASQFHDEKNVSQKA